MKSLELTDRAAKVITDIQTDKFGIQQQYKSDIADSLASLAEIINHGRDSEDIAVHTDQLLRVMNTLSDYNYLLNDIAGTADNETNQFIYSDRQSP